MIAYCADVGSVPGGSFGWARARRENGNMHVKGGSGIDDLVNLMDGDIRKGHAISLGIEAPLFLPVPVTRGDLSRGRDGERDRSCFAPAGGYVATLGVHELAYILARLKSRLPDVGATLDWKTWTGDDPKSILLWEAFVSGPAHTATGDHAQDAATAAVQFLHDLELPDGATSAVTVNNPRDSLSLAGAAMLWAGVSTAPDDLRRQALVVKPASPWTGMIERV